MARNPSEAILRYDGDTVLGEVVRNEHDEHNASVAFRISLVGPHVVGHGYGTEATRLVVDYAFDGVGLHRIHVEVYEKCGFVREGMHRAALHWDGPWQQGSAWRSCPPTPVRRQYQ